MAQIPENERSEPTELHSTPKGDINTMEKMSDKEKQMLRTLQAKQKRISRQEAAFLEEADARRDELLTRWGVIVVHKEAVPAAETYYSGDDDDVSYPDIM